MQDGVTVVAALAIFAAAALICVFLIVVLRPLLARYALAQPNPRSSHKLPTPQGGGIAVLAATIAVSAAAIYFSAPGAAASFQLALVLAAVILIAGVGVLADIQPHNIAPRLLLQALAVSAVIVAFPSDLRIIPFLPLAAERVLLVFGGLWFVNLVNFMDGLDLMTVAEVVPIVTATGLIGFFGVMPAATIAVSLALCGAMVGFAFFNRPIAKLFLGDVGSLPIALLLGWLLLFLAGSGGRTAAILLPLYYLADSTITLLRRAVSGEPVWQAHRSHFYQRATDRGFRVIGVVARVFALNVALVALALTTILLPTRTIEIVALIAGALLVASLLIVFARGPTPT
jgi:UDP-N-acetylmuramyl pentapeptide phosphotransferase/UDP-N-acetylglucosamine-1-phosphate transferase